MVKETQYHVFLSHNSADKPAIEELARRLVKEGLQPWLDKWNLIPGEPWQEAIEEALEHCATCAVFIGPSGTGPWQNEEMRAAIDRRVSESEGQFRVIPVLLPGAERGERSRLPAFLVATTWVEFRHSLDDDEALHQLVCGVQGVEPGPGPGQAIYERECPYRGLQVFDIEHAPFFFGREALTEWLLDELRPSADPGQDNRFLAIIGPSGSGKSSLARAGLLAALKRGEIEGSAQWPSAICRPGADPLESLAVALTDATGIVQTPSALRDLIHDLRDDKRMLHLTTRLTLREAPPERRLILLVDQFEELFTLCHDEELCQALIDNLLYAAGVAAGQTAVLLTVRADFYGKCAAYPALAAALTDHQVLVGPMTDEELRRAIERPALLAGCEFEPGLVELLLNDVRDQPGGLPLLQHALLELWERREGRRLTHATYLAIGGVEGALERRAEKVYNRFSEPEQEICRRIFLRLTQPGEGTEDTKRRASLGELRPAEGEQERIEAVVQTLADVRLITTEGDESTEKEPFVEVAHEALIRGWSRLRGWIDEDRAGLLTHRRLTEAAVEWERCGRDESYLYRGARLMDAEEWGKSHVDDMNPSERAFLEISITAREAKRRAERCRVTQLIAGLVIVLVVISGLAGWAVLNWRDAAQKERIARSLQLVAQSQLALEKYPQRGLLLAIEALDVLRPEDPRVPAAESTLRQALSNTGGTPLHGHEDNVIAVAFSPDGRTLATASADTTVCLWDMQDPTGSPVILRGHKDWVMAVAFSPDGRTLATASADTTVRLWDMGAPGDAPGPTTESAILRGHENWVMAMAFSLDGRTLATASADTTVRLWDMQDPTGSPVVLHGHENGVYAVAFSPDGHTLATGSQDHTARLWDMRDPTAEPAVLSGHEHNVIAVAFSPDGRTLATGSEDYTARLWDVTSLAEEPVVLYGHKGWVNVVAFSPDGRTLATGSEDYTACLWNLEEPAEEPVVLRGHEDNVIAVAFSPDGRTLATASADHTARLWEAEDPTVEPAVLRGHEGTVGAVAFNSDGRYLATASADHTARLWEAEDPTAEPVVLRRHEDNVIAVAFSPDGRTLATGSSDNTVRLWDVTSLAEEPVILRGHKASVYAVAFSPDGCTLATGSKDNTVHLWDMQDPTAGPVILRGHEYGVYAVAFSPDGHTLATGSGDHMVRLWDVEKPAEEPVILRGHKARVYAVAFSSDGRTLATGSEDNTVRLWDIKDPTAEPVILRGHEGGVTTVVFNSDGRTLATGSQDNTACLWDVTSPTAEPVVLRGHKDWVNAVAFSPDGRTLATGSEDHTACLWDLEKPAEEPVVLSGHEGSVLALAFSPDRYYLATGGADHTIRLWDLYLDNLIDPACRTTGRNLTQSEWAQYFPREEYRSTCPQWLEGE